jgi:hypothetical protein
MGSRGKLAMGLVGVGWLALALPCAGETSKKPPLSGAPAEPVGCDLRGSAKVPSNVIVYLAADGRTPVARFTGARSALWLTKVPPGSSRLGIQTGTGTGSFRIRGYIDSAQIPVVSKTRLDVTKGHLWIAEGQGVRIVEPGAGRVRVEKRLSEPIDQTFSAWATCEQLTLGAGWPAPSRVPGAALGYVLRESKLDLFDDWRETRKLVTSLQRSSHGTGVLLFGTQRAGEWVRLVYFGGIEIDAWAPSRNLVALPPGEIVDAGPALPFDSNRVLKLAESARELRPNAEVAIRLEAREQGAVIGVIEPGTETIVVNDVAGWSSVMPRSMHVAPYNDGTFWVRTSELEAAARARDGGTPQSPP